MSVDHFMRVLVVLAMSPMALFGLRVFGGFTKRCGRHAATAFIVSILFASPAAASQVVTLFDRNAAGDDVAQITLSNDHDMEVSVITYGATVTAIKVPDAKGDVRNIVLSLPDMASYHATSRRWGGIIGRYAGRIDHASFVLDGQSHQLEPGRNGVTLHGGAIGFDKRLWTYRLVSDAYSVGVVFSLISPDGDQGFPGQLALDVTYRLLRDRNELRIEYDATTTAPTVLNLTNHMYFNLAGAGVGTIEQQHLRIFADRYVATDARKIPTGAFLPVKGTPLDFRRMKPIGGDLRSDHMLIKPSAGFDHGYWLKNAKRPARKRTENWADDRLLQWVALAMDPITGRQMAIRSTETSLQFNSGNGFNGAEIGSEGVGYPIYAGFALETQNLSDSPNQPAFPSARLDPGTAFHSVTSYSFSVVATE